MGRSLALILSTQWKKKRSSKAMRKRQRGDDLVAPEIPLDLQIEIIIRLPIKSLVRFKCISKQWSSLIHSRCFNNGYLRAVSTPRVYISSVEHLDCGLMESSCNNPGKSLLLSLSLSSSENAFNLDLTMQGIGGHNMVVLRGLILYTVCRQACIYNPTTGQSVTLPAVESNFLPREDIEKSTFYYLGYDPVLDQYKVLCNEVIHSVDFEAGAQYWVFVVEAGSSWKRIEYDEPLLPTRRGLSINGVIYYLSASVMSPDTLVSFDVRSEEFNMIIAPELGVSVGFIEYGGKPTLVDYTHLVNTGLVDLWVLEDATNWSRKSLVLQPCQKHLVNNDINLWMECSTQNDEIILVPSLVRRGKYPNYILYYDLHKNDLRKVEFRGLSDHFSYPNLQVILMDACESIMRLQT